MSDLFVLTVFVFWPFAALALAALELVARRRPDHRSVVQGAVVALLATAIFVLLPRPAAALDRVSFMQESRHINLGDGWNENNPGVVFSWENVNQGEGPGLNINAGAYLNSFNRISPVATVSYRPFVWGATEIGAFAGVAYYPEDGRYQPNSINGTDTLFVGGLELVSGNVFLQAMPASRDLDRWVIAFGLTWEIE